MKRNKRKNREGMNFWQSYSDMMAALLLVFVLIISVAISQEKVKYEAEQEKYEAEQAKYEEKQKELEKKNKAIEEYEKQIQGQQEQLDRIIGVRSEIVTALTEEFKDSGLDIEIDSNTGAISFDASVLFDYNKYDLTKDGTKFLKKFFPKYFEVLLGDGIKEYVSEVIIEGHTDDNGDYLYNLDLSQKRAYSVAEYCLGEKNKMFSSEELETVRQMVTANGRSYYGLIKDENGKVDEEASRRVEVKFRLTEEEMISEIKSILEATDE